MMILDWDWQQWAVAVLVLACLWRLIRGAIAFFRRARTGDSPCSGCATPCELKGLKNNNYTYIPNEKDGKKKKCSK